MTDLNLLKSNLFENPLYLVTDDRQTTEDLVRVVQDAAKVGVGMVQIREKHGDVRAFIERAMAVKPILKQHGIPLIINDRLDVALAVDADGLHLGQSDMPVEIARKLLGPGKILGLSVENMAQLHDSQQGELDYLGVSAIFSTPTKTNTLHHWGIDGLNEAVKQSKLPLVAIGGIDASNIQDIVRTKVDSIALVSAICHAPSPKKATQALLSLIQSA